MSIPTVSLRQLIEAGAHFGHNTRRWNPKMKPYLYGVRDGVHIIDLQQSVPMLDRALKAIHDAVAAGGRVLFVGTKRQAQELVKEYAERCGQYFVNHRWLGGTLTNWKTVSNSIKRLKDLEEQFGNEQKLAGLTKKEQLNLSRERDKLNRSLGGIKDMGGRPDIIFVIDTNKETIAVAEAKVLGIPVVAILDSNSDPAGITYPIPGNDDAIRAIKLYCELIANTVLDGISDEMKSAGVDIGEAENAATEALPGESKADDGDEKTVVVKKARSRSRSAKKAAEDAAAAAEA
ncbi:MAG: 30S ribosomal protein S2 [Rhodospirillaceae bacterium]|nr:30S ribosomal protein S2 [Rhodospirillaceae bacterium]